MFPVSLYNQALIYELLFKSASATLLEFGRDKRWLGGEVGFWGILHSWGQKLWQHIHGHFVIAGGAVGEDGRWIEPRYRGKFLFPVGALSKVYRGKFIEGLKKAYYAGDLIIPDEAAELRREEGFENWINALVSKDWVVYCKPPFGNAEAVVNYIGRYTQRVAISNGRIISTEEGEIRFSYKDYSKDRIAWREMALKAEEFIKRFLWHILPDGFHKIRYYGFLANGRAKAMVKKIAQGLSTEKARELRSEGYVPEEPEGLLCPVCRKGIMVAFLIVDRWGRKIRGDCVPDYWAPETG
ncbi:MAG: hypothetical protein C4582_06825 [Desulfobacteraceae bacterium]|nr:MAG: hypothetical protein C4582_06825 [Desulfobacteraceae bacterium]